MSAMRDEPPLVDEFPEAEELGQTALVMPGRANKLAASVMPRLLPRATTTTTIMGRAMKGFDAQ